MATTKESYGTYGTVAGLEITAPSRIADERFRAWYARSARLVGDKTFTRTRKSH